MLLKHSCTVMKVFFNVFYFPATISHCSPGHKWTKWYTERPNDIGDDETLRRFRNQPDWQCSSLPSAMEAQLAKTRRPYVEGGNNFNMIGPRRGLLCLNSEQEPGNECRDYRVRFCCLPKPPKSNSPNTAASQSLFSVRPNRFARGH